MVLKPIVILMKNISHQKKDEKIINRKNKKKAVTNLKACDHQQLDIINGCFHYGIIYLLVEV